MKRILRQGTCCHLPLLH
ncbi:hypothetical protein E2C01_100171 [Portunus trituberculatus]|uniref:Uncharacterized protein n=1 Tax=Portunus trituberculatus TaxID=210409 RepID=A0A5B7KBC7_PORTR|nr:hypothetical protein [Portunus trituberculatus]